MTLFLILLALVLLIGVSWTLVVTARDGYRRIPDRPARRSAASRG